jgi:hypothetical protein
MFRCEQITNVSKVFNLHIIERYINISIISILFSQVKSTCLLILTNYFVLILLLC